MVLLVIASLSIWTTTFASNTVTVTNNTIVISAIDSDWKITDTFTGRSKFALVFISFIPGASDDKCVILNGTADTAPVLFQATSGDGEERIMYLHGLEVQLYLDFSAGTYSAGSKVIIGYK